MDAGLVGAGPSLHPLGPPQTPVVTVADMPEVSGARHSVAGTQVAGVAPTQSANRPPPGEGCEPQPRGG